MHDSIHTHHITYHITSQYIFNLSSATSSALVTVPRIQD